MTTRPGLGIVGALLVTSSLAHAGGKTKPTASADERSTQRKYDAALHRGRTLENKNDFTGALAAFKNALTFQPAAGAALSEISAVEYQLKDFPAAIEAANNAVDHSQGDQSLLAASLFNRGRAKEALGDKARAIDDFEASLNARNRKGVRDHLATLDATRAARFDPFAAKPMSAPTPLEAYCTGGKRSKGAKDSGGDPSDVTCDNSANYFRGIKGTANKDKGPIAEIRLVVDTDYFQEGHGTDELFAMVRTSKGWSRSASLDQTWNNSHCDDEATIGDWSITDGGTRAILRIHHVESCAGGGNSEDIDSDSVAVIGVGASGLPSIIGPVEFQRSTTDTAHLGDTDETDKSSKLEYTMQLTGAALTLTKKVGGDPDGLAGVHPLIFP